MRDAVIVSTARTPIGKAYRGAFNLTHGADPGGHSLSHAGQRAGIDPGEVEDLIIGCGMPQGATGYKIGRQIAIIQSMTKAERANPDVLKHSRKKRIAAGSGTDAADINKLLKMHRQMADMMKAMGGKGKGGSQGKCEAGHFSLHFELFGSESYLNLPVQFGKRKMNSSVQNLRLCPPIHGID